MRELNTDKLKSAVLESSIDYLEPGRGAYSGIEAIRVALQDQEFAEKVVRMNPRRALQLIPNDILVANPNLYAVAMERDTSLVHGVVPMTVKETYPELCLKIVQKEPWTLQDMPGKLQDEHPDEIIAAIADTEPSALRFLKPSIMMGNQEKCMEIVKKDPSHSLQHIPVEMQELHEQEIIDIVNENPNAYMYIKSDNIKNNNPEMAVEALKKDSSIMSDIPIQILRDNMDLCKEIIKGNKNAWYSLPEELQEEIDEPDWFNSQDMDQGNDDVKPDMPMQQVTESKFKQIYQKAKGKLRGFVDKLKDRFNKDRNKEEKNNEITVEKDNNSEVR